MVRNVIAMAIIKIWNIIPDSVPPFIVFRGVFKIKQNSQKAHSHFRYHKANILKFITVNRAFQDDSRTWLIFLYSGIIATITSSGWNLNMVRGAFDHKSQQMSRH